MTSGVFVSFNDSLVRERRDGVGDGGVGDGVGDVVRRRVVVFVDSSLVRLSGSEGTVRLSGSEWTVLLRLSLGSKRVLLVSRDSQQQYFI